MPPEVKIDKYFALIDAIVELQDIGLGDSKLSSLQDHANMKITELRSELEEREKGGI